MRRSSDVEALEALLEATRVVAAAGDLDATLDALSERTRDLLRAADVAVSLVVPGTDHLMRDRPSSLADLDSPYAQPGSVAEQNDCTLEAQATGRAVFSIDIHADPRIPAAVRAAFGSVVSTLYVPLRAEARQLGMLIVHWTRQHIPSAAEIRAAEALAAQAAIAVRGARLLEDARRAQAEEQRVRAEMEAVLDASDASVLVFSLRGEVVRANRRARERLPALFGGLPRTLADLRALAGAKRPDGTPANVEWNAVARGEELDTVVQISARDGGVHWIHAHVAPVRDDDGTLSAIVLLTRDITELHDAIAARGRLDGAVLTARRAAHEMNNQLAPVVGYGEMLVGMVTGDAAEMANRMQVAATRAARTLEQLQRIIRFEETEFGGQPMLDLEAATSGGPTRG